MNGNRTALFPIKTFLPNHFPKHHLNTTSLSHLQPISFHKLSKCNSKHSSLRASFVSQSTANSFFPASQMRASAKHRLIAMERAVPTRLASLEDISLLGAATPRHLVGCVEILFPLNESNKWLSRWKEDMRYTKRVDLTQCEGHKLGHCRREGLGQICLVAFA